MAILTGQDIINKFELYTDDTTELATQEELDLANEKYQEINSLRAWRYLIKPFTGTQTAGVVTLPADFKYIPITSGHPGINDEGQGPVVYVGPQFQRYAIINPEDARQYTNVSGYAYIDYLNQQLIFTSTPQYSDVYFDYIHRPADLTLSTAPIFHEDYHYAIVHAMAVDDMSLQLFDKARSYASSNQTKYEKKIEDLANWDAQFYMQ